MSNLVKRLAEPAPVEPPGHAEFERFIRDLDAGRLDDGMRTNPKR